MKDQTTKKRQALVKLSGNVRESVNDGEFNTINEALLQQYREETGASRFDTFRQWKLKGYHVNKGEEAYCVWGSPVSKPVENSRDDFRFFPLCFLFSDQQVSQN